MDSKQKYKLKKFVRELSQIRGRHTELVSVYIPSGYDIQKIINHLAEEQGTASNIKDKTTRKNVQDSLERMIRHLRLIPKTPVNGLASFSGNILAQEGKQNIQVWSIEPPVPLNMRIYRCSQTFILEPLLEMLEDRNVYALIAMDNREATIGIMRGKKIEVIKQMHSMVPGKFKAGGQCLNKSTKVNLFDGQCVDIETLIEGDLVLSYDFENKKFIESKVVKVWEVEKDKVFTICGGEYEIICSEDHLFFVDTKLVAACELKVGDCLIDENNKNVLISRITFEEKVETMIDIEVENKSFVANGIVVHNSQQRFARLREEAAADFYKKVATIMNEEFLAMGHDLKGILIGGPGMTKETFANGNWINNQLKLKVIAVKDLSYTNEFGLKELLERSQDKLAQEEIILEKGVMGEFLTGLAKESTKVVYGIKDVEKALQYGAVEKLLISEDFPGDHQKYEELAEESNSHFFVISTETEEGVALKDLGGIAALLRFPIGE